MSNSTNHQGEALPVEWKSIFVDEGKNGIVCFWDHETTEITTLAVTLGDFLELLQPFDISSVKLKPGQVKRVWVDPEFLNALRNNI
jgi:hypothetical protein